MYQEKPDRVIEEVPDFGDDLPETACCFCGEKEQVSLFEIWGSHEFQIETCCSGLHDSIVHEMNLDRIN